MISVISGSNQFAKQEKLSELKHEFIKVHGADGVEQYEAESIAAQELRSMLTGVTLFATQRLVVIKNLSSSKQLSEALLDCTSAIPDEVQLVLYESQLDKRTSLYKILKKEASVHEFTELDTSTLIKWAQELVKNRHGSMTVAVAEMLVSSVGNDQLRLRSEIEKLLSYDSKITTENVELLVEKTPQEAVFSLLDAALGGNTQNALELLDGMERAHDDAFQLANMLVWQTHVLAVVHAGLTQSDAEIAKAAKINPFVVKKTRGMTRNLSKSHLRRIIDTVADCDVTLKTTSVDPWRVLEHTILALR